MSKAQQDEWRMVDIDSPQQYPNGTDCGVFMLLNIQLLAQRLSLGYGNQGQQLQVTSAFRYAIADAILREASRSDGTSGKSNDQQGSSSSSSSSSDNTNGESGKDSGLKNPEGSSGHVVDKYDTTSSIKIICYAQGSEGTTTIQPCQNMVEQLEMLKSTKLLLETEIGIGDLDRQTEQKLME